jgi:hypothetical protein
MENTQLCDINLVRSKTGENTEEILESMSIVKDYCMNPSSLRGEQADYHAQFTSFYDYFSWTNYY